MRRLLIMLCLGILSNRLRGRMCRETLYQYFAGGKVLLPADRTGGPRRRRRAGFHHQQPDFNVDPYQKPGYWKKSQDTYKLEAYNADGRFLWRYDMGWAIEEGIWYSPYVVYDLDGDGKAEVYARPARATPRRARAGQSRPEWLLKLDGRTGKVVKKIPWIPRLPTTGEYNHYLPQPAGRRLPGRQAAAPHHAARHVQCYQNLGAGPRFQRHLEA